MARGGLSPPSLLRHTIAAARTQLDDLQSEMEAGARYVQKIARRAANLELIERREEAIDELNELRSRAGDLRRSLEQQRQLMLGLRSSLDSLRRHVSTQLDRKQVGRKLDAE